MVLEVTIKKLVKHLQCVDGKKGTKETISDNEESNSTVVDKRKLPKLWFNT